MKDSLGLESGTVRVVEYDERWPALFLAESQRLREACQPLPLHFEHVGSTAVPGLCAKPVLDILAGHPRGTSVDEYVAHLERAGYEHRGNAGIPDHQFFRRGQPRAYHIHLVEKGGRLWKEYLAFRDSLRANAAVARQYRDLKQALAARFPRDREAYIQGKAAFVAEVIRHPRSETTMKLYTQLNFGGNCEAAFRFYEKHLGGKITMMMNQSQAPGAPSGAGKAIIHARMDIGDSVLIGNDVPPNVFQKIRSVYIYLGVDSPQEAERAHMRLADGGEVYMPMQETFFATRFSQLRDKFGVLWSIIHERPRP